MRRFFLLLVILLIPFNTPAEDKIILTPDPMGHKGMINDLIVTKDKKYIVTCSEDKTIRVWNIDKAMEERKILGEKKAGSYGKVYSIAISPDNKYLAASGFFGMNSLSFKEGKIRIFDFKSGKLLQVLDEEHSISNDLQFDSSGKYIVTGTFGKSIVIYRKGSSGFEFYKRFKEHSGTIYSVAFFDKNNTKYAVSGGYDKKIILYDIKKGKIASYEHSHRIHSIGVSGKYIAACGYGNKILILDHKLNLVKEIISETSPVGVSFSGTGKYLLTGIKARPTNCNIYDTENSFKKVSSFSRHQNVVQALGFIDDNTAVTAGGSSYELAFWNPLTGKLIKEISGKGERVWNLGISGNLISIGNKYIKEGEKIVFDKYLNLEDFSISNSSSLKFKGTDKNYQEFSLSHKKGDKFGFLNGILVIKKQGKVIKEIVKGSSEGYRHRSYGFTDKGIIISGGNNGHLIAYSKKGKKIAVFLGHDMAIRSMAIQGNTLVTGGGDQVIRFWNLDDLDVNQKNIQNIYPYLNILISIDNEWVAWSRSGYYNSSVGGDKFVGFHENRGPYKEAEFYPSQRFFKTYFNPELISNLIKLKNEEKAVLYTKKSKRVVEADSEKILPPKIILNTDKSLTTSSETIVLDFYVDPNSNNRVKNIKVFLNGRQVSERGLKRKKKNDNLIHIKKNITLDQKENIIKIIAENDYSTSNPVYINAEYIRKKEMFKPSLYLLSVGVSDYRDTSLNLDYASKDALSVKEIFKKQEGRIFREVKSKLILNENATRINILKGLNWVQKEATQKDLVIIFIAGHGINDDFSGYFFLPHDADKDFLSGTSVEWTRFDNLLRNLPSKVILLADACHSGNITGGKKRSADITGALKELLSSGTGQVIMTATTGGSYAYENSLWGHGAFTRALNDGLNLGKADYNRDNIISIKELDFYVTFRVKELTKGKQKPTTIVPASIPDFPVFVR